MDPDLESLQSQYKAVEDALAQSPRTNKRHDHARQLKVVINGLSLYPETPEASQLLLKACRLRARIKQDLASPSEEVIQLRKDVELLNLRNKRLEKEIRGLKRSKAQLTEERGDLREQLKLLAALRENEKQKTKDAKRITRQLTRSRDGKIQSGISAAIATPATFVDEDNIETFSAEVVEETVSDGTSITVKAHTSDSTLRDQVLESVFQGTAVSNSNGQPTKTFKLTNVSNASPGNGNGSTTPRRSQDFVPPSSAPPVPPGSAPGTTPSLNPSALCVTPNEDTPGSRTRSSSRVRVLVTPEKHATPSAPASSAAPTPAPASAPALAPAAPIVVTPVAAVVAAAATREKSSSITLPFTPPSTPPPVPGSVTSNPTASKSTTSTTNTTTVSPVVANSSAVKPLIRAKSATPETRAAGKHRAKGNNSTAAAPASKTSLSLLVENTKRSTSPSINTSSLDDESSTSSRDDNEKPPLTPKSLRKETSGTAINSTGASSSSSLTSSTELTGSANSGSGSPPTSPPPITDDNVPLPVFDDNNLILDIVAGLEVTITSRHWEKDDTMLIPQDYDYWYQFKVKRSGRALLKFKDFAPKVFSQVRKYFGVTEQQYLATFQYENLISGFVRGEGKSGAFFVFTRDRQFIIKTTTEEERTFLWGLLPYYWQYIKRNPDTFLPRFYGVYSMKHEGIGGVTRFVVMNNVFNTPLSPVEKFDLKGSTLGRSAAASGAKKRPATGLILKDLDIMESHRVMYLPKHLRKPWKEQLKKDTEFLAQHNVMDYSLLIGIYYDLSQAPISTNTSASTTAASSSTASASSNTTLPSPATNIFNATVNNPSNTTTGTSSPTAAGSTTPTGQRLLLGGESGTQGSSGNPAPTPLAAAANNNSIFNSNPVFNLAASLSAYDSASTRITTMRKNIWQQCRNGVEGVSPEGRKEVYFIGIIDILVQYDVRKKMENFMKTSFASHTQDEVSVVPPDFYQSRFLDFMQRLLPSKNSPVATTTTTTSTTSTSTSASPTNSTSTAAPPVRKKISGKSGQSPQVPTKAPAQLEVSEDSSSEGSEDTSERVAPITPTGGTGINSRRTMV